MHDYSRDVLVRRPGGRKSHRHMPFIVLYCIVLFFIVAGTYNHHIHVQFLIIIPSP